MPDTDELAFWEKRWRDCLADPEQNTATKWDWSPTDDAVREALLAAAGPDMAGLRILEVGSGTAKVSSCLAKRGALVTLVDAAPSALTLGRRLFHSLGLVGEFVQADMASLPFESAAFDLVWNSGVMEHYVGEEREHAFREQLRLVKPGGHFVTINPNARCLLYRVTMYHAAQSGGAGILEVPAVSLREELSRLGLEVTAEYPAAFASSAIFFAGLPGAAPLARLIAEWYEQLSPEEREFFPGYLLVTVGRQPEGPFYGWPVDFLREERGTPGEDLLPPSSKDRQKPRPEREPDASWIVRQRRSQPPRPTPTGGATR